MRRGLVDTIVAAEQAGIEAAWMTSGGVAPDPLAVFAAAAGRTTSIKFGTCIIPTFPRHPLALVQGAVVVDSLAPGRLRLGVGPSHQVSIEANLRHSLRNGPWSTCANAFRSSGPSFRRGRWTSRASGSRPARNFPGQRV